MPRMKSPTTTHISAFPSCPLPSENRIPSVEVLCRVEEIGYGVRTVGKVESYRAPDPVVAVHSVQDPKLEAGPVRSVHGVQVPLLASPLDASRLVK